MMRIFMLVRYPLVHGPVVKLMPLLIGALQELGCVIKTTQWGRHKEQETWIEKIVGRIRDLIRIRKELQKDQFDVMIVQTSHNWATLAREIPLLLLTRRLCSCIVIQMHGSQSNRMIVNGSILFKIATRWLLEWCDAVLVLSMEEQRQWQQFYPQGKFYVVDNPFLPLGEQSKIDMPWDIPADCPVLLFVGRLIVEKGIYELLESLTIILRQKKCHLLIVGDGIEKMRLHKKINDLGLDHYITLAGYLKGEQQLFSVYQRADVFILPSYSEGFPTVITEAMSVGLPIITTQIRGMADHLTEGENALFVPPRDPALLAATILKLLDEPELQASMRIANREKLRQFQPAVVGKKYHNVIKEILDDRGNDD